jgi:glutamyl-tRNA reductase
MRPMIAPSAALTAPSAALFVASLNHRSTPIEIRECLALSAEDVRAVLLEFENVAEALLLSTCNRVEVYAVGDPSRAARAFDGIAARRGVDTETVRSHVVTCAGEAALRHCFRVAASLDSMILGEPQILGQVKEAFALAQAAGTIGPMLHRVMEQAFTVAKRVRTETALGQHAVSVPFAAVELAKKIFGNLAGTSALLIGAGEMGELAARHLRDQGAGPLVVANRTRAKADALATDLGGQAIAFDRWRTALASTDIVITSTGAPETIVSVAAVREVLGHRGSRPLFFIDIAVPRDVDSAVGDLPNVFCYDVDDLTHVVEANLREREHEAKKAEALVEREVGRFVKRLGGLGAVPTIVSLRRRVEDIRKAEVARALARLSNASPETRQAVEALSAAIVNKILHAPTVKLREVSENGAGERWAAAVAELFALDTPPEPADETRTGAQSVRAFPGGLLRTAR